MCFEMAKLNSKKRKKSSFFEVKSLVGLTPVVKILLLGSFCYSVTCLKFTTYLLTSNSRIEGTVISSVSGVYEYQFHL
jgi:uncharacterized membrane protein